jgi:ATP-dependent DNA ligase
LEAVRAHPARNAFCFLPSAFRLLLSAFCLLYYSFVPKQSFPDWVQPMAATLTQERFTDPEWSFERKFDGIRLLAYKKGRKVELFSRNHLPQNLPAISQAIAKLPHRELILDGEITWHAPFSYHIFDIMWIDGRETMSLPLEERRALLHQLPLTAPLRRVTELPGESAWKRAQKEGWEGVVAKRRSSIYEQRRSRNWLKMKCEMAQEFVVGGFTDPQGKRVGLGALLVGYYERSERDNKRGSSPTVREGASYPMSKVQRPKSNVYGGSSPTVREGVLSDDFVYAGKIGTGFNTELLLELRRKLDAIEIAKPPFTRAVGLPRLRAHWVQPKIVVQVGFIQWTGHGKLRHPRLLGVRHDKDAREVVRE